MHRYYDLKQLQLLFERLKVTVDQNEIDTLEASIWQVWIDARSETINEKMFEGAKYLSEQEYCEAILVFTEMTERWETYSEAWNKRATAYNLKGEYKKSLEDIATTFCGTLRKGYYL